MANNPLQEMMAAFAVGCMDKENFEQFKDYMQSGGELPNEEMGELQNIVAMIPVILDLENPDPALKDNVAKKLIEMKDEIKSRIREERKKTFATKTTRTIGFASKKTSKVTLSDEAKPEDEHYPDTFHTTEKINVPAEVTKNVTNDLRSTKLDEDQPQSLFAHQQLTQQEIKPAPIDRNNVSLIGWIALLVAIFLAGALGYLFYSSVTTINNKVEILESKISSLRGEIATSTNFVNNYIAVLEFFNYRDVEVVNLTSQNPADKAMARVFLAFNEKEGLIQFKNTTPLQQNQGYQLWIESKGQSYSMGVYQPAGDDYIRITEFPFIPREQIQQFKITVESQSGSPTPSIQKYLVADFK